MGFALTKRRQLSNKKGLKDELRKVKMMNFVLNMIDFALKMMNFVLKMMDFVLKMMDFVLYRSPRKALC